MPTELQSKPFIHLAALGTIPNTCESQIFVRKISLLPQNASFLYSFWNSVRTTWYSPRQNSVLKRGNLSNTPNVKEWTRWCFSYIESCALDRRQSSGPLFLVYILLETNRDVSKRHSGCREIVLKSHVLGYKICFITESTMATISELWPAFMRYSTTSKISFREFR